MHVINLQDILNDIKQLPIKQKNEMYFVKVKHTNSVLILKLLNVICFLFLLIT